MKDMSAVALGNLVTVSEAAERLQIDEALVKKYIYQGRMRAEKKSRIWLIDAESLEKFASIPRSAGNPNFSKKSS